MITPRDQLFYRPFLDDPRFPSDGTIPSDTSMWQPRLGLSWDPGDDGKQVIRASGGIFYSRIPGLSLASTRSTDGTRGQTLYPRQHVQRLRSHAADVAESDPG